MNQYTMMSSSKKVMLIALVLIAVLLCGIANAEETPYISQIQNGRAIITGVRSTFSGSLTIPETIDGYPVTEIGDEAFLNCTGITAVSLPSSLTKIGGFAFSGCTGLSSIDIPAGVTDIRQHAFDGCTSLASVTLSDDLAVFTKGVFKNCTSLKTMNPVHRTKVTSVSLDMAAQSVDHKSTVSISATVTPSNANNTALIWTSSDETIATVVGGTVTGVAPGEATITCTAADNSAVSAVCTVTVVPVKPTSISADDLTVTLGETKSVSVQLVPDYATCTFSYTVADNTIATVGADGTVTGIAIGQTTVSVASDNNLSTDLTVTVVCPGHNIITDAAVAPACEATGLTEGSHCSICNEVLVAQEVVPATGHTVVTDAAVPHTCTEDGLTEGSHCSVCEKVLVAQEIDPAAHTVVTDEAVPNSCTEDGLTEGSHCSVCSTVFVAQEVIPAAHTVVTDNAVPPTCEDSGLSEGSHCSVCSEVLVAQEVVPPTGHTVVTDNAVPPTCEEPGLSEGSHCSVCEKILVAQEEVAATGHTVVTDAAVPHTCAEDGLTEGSHCSVCEKVLVAQEIDPAAHTPVTDPAVPHTCTEDGLTEGSHCSVCETVLVVQEIVPAAHTVVVDEAVVPTQSSTGLTEGSHCSVCNEVIVAQEVVQLYDYKTVNKLLTLTAYNGNEEEVIIPSKFNGTELEVIGTEAFKDNEWTKSVQLPQTITTIEPNAFVDCEVLKKVIIPDSVTTIGKDAIPKTAKVYCGKESYAAKWAIANNIDVVYIGPAISEEPQDLTITDGETATFGIKASGSGLTYQWQQSVNGNEWKDSEYNGNTTAELTFTALTADTDLQFRCVVTDKDGIIAISKPAALTVGIPTAIEKQPESITATEGTTVLFKVEAEGDQLTYQWQYMTPGSAWYDSPAAGNKTPELTVPATMDRNGFKYRCIIRDAAKNEIVSDPATLTVEAGLQITRQPANQSGSNGNIVIFSVTASGNELTYQWQYKIPNGSWFDSPATGNKTASLSVPATTDRNGYQYRCIVKDKNGNSITSEPATLTSVSALKIVTQPTDQTGSGGNIVKFTVSAEGNNIKYQWQYKIPNGSWFASPATGNNTASLSVPATTDRSGYQYRCVVTDAAGNTVTSNAATLTYGTGLQITSQPTNQTGSNGTTVKFTVAASGDGVAYQWQYKAPSGTWANSPATGNNTASLSVPATTDRNGYQYRCIVSDKNGNKLTSNTATLTVGASLQITSQPTNQSGSNGTTVKFTVAASGDGIAYQWQYKTPSGSWANSPATGNNTASLSVPATTDRNGYQYRCIVSDKSGNKLTSNAATLTVGASLQITSQPTNQSGSNGSTVKFTVAASGTGVTYQWQYKYPGGDWANSPATGSTTASLSVPATADRNGYQYRCIVSDKSGNKVTSNAATLTVATLKITTQPSNQTGSSGSTVKFTIAASGDGVAYQWQYKTPSGSWANSPATGNNTASLSVPATTDRNGYQYRCIVSDKSGNKLTSNAATLTVASLKITTQPSNQTGSNGNTVKFTVAASGDGVAYQWQYKTPSGSWTNSPAAGNNTASLSVPATTDRNGYQYRCIVSDKYGNKLTSNAGTLTVASLSITAQPKNQTEANGNKAKFTISASGEGLSYQWQYKVGSGSWTDSPAEGNKTNTLIVPATPDRNGFQYRCIVKDKYGNKVTSNAATLTVQ